MKYLFADVVALALEISEEEVYELARSAHRIQYAQKVTQITDDAALSL
jgi:hypothetical protein